MALSKSVIPWLEGLNVSASYFDDEHRALLEKFNALVNAVASRSRERVLAANSQLREVAKAHFESEERQMREKRYRAADEHRASHARLLQSLARFHEQVGAMQDLSGLPEAASFLEQWLVPHLTNDDKLFSEFLAARRLIEKSSPV